MLLDEKYIYIYIYIYIFYPFTIVNLVIIRQAKSHSVDILSEMPLLLLIIIIIIIIARPITIGPPTKPPTKPPTHHNHEGDHQDICPVIRLPDDDNGTCILSDHCSKVTCTSPPDSTGPFGHMVLTVQTYGCRQPLQATVNLESYTDKESVTSGMKWSHTFEDGEKAELPIALPDAPANMKVFLKAELKKNGGNIHFKVQHNTYLPGDGLLLVLLVQAKTERKLH